MNDASILTQLIIKLYQRLNDVKPNTEIKESISHLVKSNGLENNNNVPKWLINFFQLILEGKSTEKLYITSENNAKIEEADVWNFLAELERVIKMECEDSGEEIEIVFNSLGIYALISVESGFYQIQSVDDPQCKSYAREKFLKYKSL